MGTESMNPAEKDQEEEQSQGCVSLTTFTLKRANITESPSNHIGAENMVEPEISSPPSLFEIDDFATLMRSFKYKQRPWIVFDRSEIGTEHDVEQHDMGSSPKVLLPKGVTRGCSECNGCQKVSARWKPEGSCSYDLKDTIAFYPSEEDFMDIFKYIESIRHQAEPYGVCRIIPPSSWKVPSFLEEDEIWQQYKFSTRVQKIHELQNHGFYTKLPLDGDTREAKRRKLDPELGDACAANFVSGECHGLEGFQIDSGPEFSLIAFKRYADDFKRFYFSEEVRVGNEETVNQEPREPTEENIEGEYWRIVEKPTEQIEVLYSTNTLRGELGGLSNPGPTSDSIEGSSLDWDLNHLYKLPGSLLSFETLDSSSILLPQLHIGMCFSSLPWTIEEHLLYKLQYLHLGAPRICYGTPGSHRYKFEAISKKHFPLSDEEHVELLHRPGRQLSPSTIKSEGIPIYRCIQRPGEFVLFLPGAYHSGFDCGFNCATSSVLAPLDWLPHGLLSVELYREKRRKTLICFDKLLLRASDEAVKAQWENLLRGKKTSKVLMWKEASGKDKVLAKTLEARIKSEIRCRDFLSFRSQTKKMDESFNIDCWKLECTICCYDLYLSAVSCHCNPNKFSCLVHAKFLCTCPWAEKIFHFRFLIPELIILLEALGGKLSAIRTWEKEKLSRALQWGDKPEQGQNVPTLGPSSGSVEYKVASQKERASDPSLVSEAQKSILGMKSNDSKVKAIDVGLKDGGDDTGSSSSSDCDIEEYIARLEKSCKSEAFGPSSNEEGKSIPNEHNAVQ